MRTSSPVADEDTAAPPVRELTAGQQSLWLQHTLAPRGTAYNDGGAALITPPPPIGPLRHAVHATAQRHDLLRSVFTESRGRPVRMVR